MMEIKLKDAHGSRTIGIAPKGICPGLQPQKQILALIAEKYMYFRSKTSQTSLS